MFLFLLENGNLLLGYVPETLGLLLFGVALIAITVLLRWILSINEQENNSQENLEVLAESIKR